MKLKRLAAVAFLLASSQFSPAGAFGAQTQGLFWPGGVQRTFAQDGSSAVGELPTALSSEQFSGTSFVRPMPQVVVRAHHPRPGFYRSAKNRPLTQREVAMREAVYDLARHPKQFVHVRLRDGRILTGVITYSETQCFVLQTGIIMGEHSLRYADLAEPPRHVPAVGTRIVHGLEWTGLVTACVAAIPLALVFYPLVLAGVIQD